MTDATQRALPPLPEMQERHNYYGDPLPRSGYTAKQMQAYALAAIAEILADYAALQARIAELEARNAASERVLSEAPVGDCLGQTQSAAIVHMRDPHRVKGKRVALVALADLEAIDAHAQGQAGEGKDG